MRRLLACALAAVPLAVAAAEPAVPAATPEALSAEKAAVLIPRTGKELVEQIRVCRESVSRPERLEICHGLQTGIVSGLAVASVITGQRMPFCLPDGIEDRDIDDAVVAFVEGRTDAASWGSTFTVIAALVDRYPCPATGASSNLPKTP